MSKVGRTSEIESILNKSFKLGPYISLNNKFYCSNCYCMDLYYREVETGIFDIWCKNCNKHFTKSKKCNKCAN